MKTMTRTNQTTAISQSIFVDAAGQLKAKPRQAVLAIYEYVDMAREVAGNKDVNVAVKELQELRDQTYEAVETGRSLNPVIKNFAEAVRTYKIDPQLLEELYKSLDMEAVNTTYTVKQYKSYIAGMGEAVGVMILKVLCHKRAVLHHKLMPAARAFGAAVCKVNLLLDHGHAHKRHGKMYFPDVTKSTFNQARLAQLIVDIESDFMVARSAIASLPPGSKVATCFVYAYHYQLLRQMRKLTPTQIDAGMARISGLQKMLLLTKCYLMPGRAIRAHQNY